MEENRQIIARYSEIGDSFHYDTYICKCTLLVCQNVNSNVFPIQANCTRHGEGKGSSDCITATT